MTNKSCKICGNELVLNEDYSGNCHSIHKFTHHDCFTKEREKNMDDKARRELES